MESKKGKKEIEYLGMKGIIEIELFKSYENGNYKNDVKAIFEDESLNGWSVDQNDLNGAIEMAKDFIEKKIEMKHSEAQKPILDNMLADGFMFESTIDNQEKEIEIVHPTEEEVLEDMANKKFPEPPTPPEDRVIKEGEEPTPPKSEISLDDW